MSADPLRQDSGSWWPRGWRRLHVVILCFAVAAIVALIVQRVIPPPATDLVMICANDSAFEAVDRIGSLDRPNESGPVSLIATKNLTRRPTRQLGRLAWL